MKFELNKSQMLKLAEWQREIKERFGKYGHYDYIFTPYGIGDGIKVVSHLTKKTLDLSDVDKW